MGSNSKKVKGLQAHSQHLFNLGRKKVSLGFSVENSNSCDLVWDFSVEKNGKENWENSHIEKVCQNMERRIGFYFQN